MFNVVLQTTKSSIYVSDYKHLVDGLYLGFFSDNYSETNTPVFIMIRREGMKTKPPIYHIYDLKNRWLRDISNNNFTGLVVTKKITDEDCKI